MGVTKNYSHWAVAYKPKQKDYNRDYDIINSTEVLEYFNDLGGTKTMGGVNDFYFGNRNHKLIKKIEANRKQFAEAHGLALGRSTVSRRFFYLDTLLQNGVRVINGAIICGVGMSGNHLTTIYASENGKMRKFKATLTVDATGDADIAYFAGED